MSKTLLGTWLDILTGWRPHFPQQRTYHRAVRQALGSLVCLGRRCLSRIIWANGGQQRNWSSEYFLHARCQWDPPALFNNVLRRALPYCRGRLVGVAVDDTRLRKTGRAIPQAFYQRDPLSALSPQPDARSALSASLLAGALASPRQRRLSRSAPAL